MTCADCRFWKRTDEDDMGLCRRNPPAIGPITGTGDFDTGRWPYALATDLCGEYQPLPLQQVKETQEGRS